jgi:hypothetical protein
MCSRMLTGQSVLTGASPVRGGWFEICHPIHEEFEAEANPLHMNWVLVDATKGNRRAQMPWVVAR